MSSSPDPLNDTPTYQSTRVPRTSRPRYSLPPQPSSPTKQTFELDIGNQRLTQKIRVTVEAGSDVENEYPGNHAQYGTPSPSKSPIRGLKAKTTTTTIPLKGLSDSEDERLATPKKGRGRPRKSATPVATKSGKRVSTPVKKSAGRRKSIGDLVDGDDEEDLDFSMGKNVEITRRGRPRSISMKGKPRKSVSTATQIESGSVAPGTTTRKARGKGRKKTLAQDDFVNQLGEDHVETQDSNKNNAAGLEEQDPHSKDADEMPSAYSTIRSALSMGENIEDIVVARFESGNETPRRPGWSSPRYIEAPQALQSAQDQIGYLSPFPSPEHLVTFSQGREEHLSTPRRDLDSGDVADYQEQDCIEQPLVTESEEYREFDTILESEGFSMISVDSVPSLREHLSSPATQSTTVEQGSSSGSDEGSSNSQSGSQPCNSIQISRSPNHDQMNLNPKLLPVQRTSANDSFSSIPPEILDAASPAKKTHVSRLSGRFAVQNDSLSSIAPDILDAATPAQPRIHIASSSAVLISGDAYDDSFSAIPSAILDAATPAPVRQMLRKAQAIDPIKLCVPGSTSVFSRLLTPDETPSPPIDNSAYQSSKLATKAWHCSAVVPEASNLEDDSPGIRSHMASSPPAAVPRRYTYTAHLRQHRQLRPDVTETPSIVFSSPSLPPPLQHNRANHSLAAKQDQGPRPTLSPIARAGRVLQDVIVPINSPRSRAQSLGSPFKSPVAGQSHLSLAEQNWISPRLLELDMSTETALSSSLVGADHELKHQDDPFGSHAPPHHKSLSPAEKEGYSLGLPHGRPDLKSRASRDVSLSDSIRSEDEMSWQTEQEVAWPTVVPPSSSKPGAPKEIVETSEEGYSTADGNTGSWEQRWATKRAAVSKEINSAPSGKVIIVESDDEENGCEDQDGNVDDEDFGLLLETLNSSSPAPQPPQQLSRDTVEKPRRSKLPSPWRKNSKRLVYSDEHYNLSATSEDLFAAAEKHLEKPSKLDAVTVRRAMPASQHNDNVEADLSGWHIPQKSNFQPRTRDSAANVDLSALFASSPTKSALNLLKIVQRPTHQDEAQPASSTTEIATGSTACKDENARYAPIPQKMDFKPRPRNSSFGSVNSSPVKASSLGIFCPPSIGSFIKKPTPIPSSSTNSSKVLAPSSPSRTNSLSYPSQLIAPAKPDQSPATRLSSPGYDSSFISVSVNENENDETNKRTLKWTESLRLASSSSAHDPQPLKLSPSKSCLRSPLKTPSHDPSSHSAPSPSPSKTVAFVSSSPTPSSHTTPPLSTITWTRDHWVLLDSILHTWKPENQSPDTQQRRRRNSTRVISKLLGRMVRAQGEELRLEQWHLEVVDEFRERVRGQGAGDGWEEKVVARRVFALLIGEKRRREGLVTD